MMESIPRFCKHCFKWHQNCADFANFFWVVFTGFYPAPSLPSVSIPWKSSGITESNKVIATSSSTNLDMEFDYENHTEIQIIVFTGYIVWVIEKMLGKPSPLRNFSPI